jgi:hypothetical protein
MPQLRIKLIIRRAASEELQVYLIDFPKYHMNVLLGNVIAKMGREGILKPKNWEREFTRN